MKILFLSHLVLLEEVEICQWKNTAKILWYESNYYQRLVGAVILVWSLEIAFGLLALKSKVQKKLI